MKVLRVLIVLILAGASFGPARATLGAAESEPQRPEEQTERKKAAAEEEPAPSIEPAEGEILGASRMTWGEARELCASSGETPAASTEGRLVTFRAEDELKRLFTAGGKVVLCQNKVVEEPDDQFVDPALRSAIAAARVDMAQRLGVSPAVIRTVTAEKVTWRDSSLGCPEPDRVYMQMLTPGVRIRLEVDGRSYAYHMAEGGEPVFCETPSALEPLPAVEYE